MCPCAIETRNLGVAGHVVQGQGDGKMDVPPQFHCVGGGQAMRMVLAGQADKGAVVMAQPRADAFTVQPHTEDTSSRQRRRV